MTDAIYYAYDPGAQGYRLFEQGDRPETASDGEPAFLASPGADSYLTRVELPDGRIGVLVGPGSVWDLRGSQWAKSAAQQAHAHGANPPYELDAPGVGSGSQHCARDSHFPMALRAPSGEERTGLLAPDKRPPCRTASNYQLHIRTHTLAAVSRQLLR